MEQWKRGIAVFDRQIPSGSHAGKQGYFFAGQVLEQRDHATNANHRQHRAKSNANQMASKQEAQQDGESDVTQVKAVFGKAHVPMDAIRKSLDDAVTRVGNEPHGKRHGGTDASAQNCQKQDYYAKGELIRPARRAGRKVRQKRSEQVQKTGENQTEGNLQQIHQQHETLIAFRMLPPLDAVQNQFHYNKGTIKNHGRIAKVQLENLGNAVGDRNNRRNAEPGFGVQRQTHCQN